MKSGLNTILKAEDPVTFLVYGSKDENLKALWNYMKSELEHLQESEVQTLLRVLKYFIKKVNLLYREPMYELMEDELGKWYDDSRHSRSSDSRLYSGEIQEVLLPGIWNRYTKKADCKSVVRV